MSKRPARRQGCSGTRRDREAAAQRQPHPEAGPEPPAQMLGSADDSVDRRVQVPHGPLEEIGQAILGDHVNCPLRARAGHGWNKCCWSPLSSSRNWASPLVFRLLTAAGVTPISPATDSML